MGLDCPRCSVGKLEEIEVDDILIDRCIVCGGLWFDQGELGQMIGGEEGVKQLEEKIPDSPGGIACPRCAQIDLRRQNICQFNGNDIDIFRCPSCLGSWIDRGVLRKSEDSSIAQSTRQCFSEILKQH